MSDSSFTARAPAPAPASAPNGRAIFSMLGMCLTTLLFFYSSFFLWPMLPNVVLRCYLLLYNCLIPVLACSSLRCVRVRACDERETEIEGEVSLKREEGRGIRKKGAL